MPFNSSRIFVFIRLCATIFRFFLIFIKCLILLNEYKRSLQGLLNYVISLFARPYIIIITPLCANY